MLKGPKNQGDVCSAAWVGSLQGWKFTNRSYFEKIINIIYKTVGLWIKTPGNPRLQMCNSTVPLVCSCRGEWLQKLTCCINITSTSAQAREREPTTRGWFSNWNSLIHVCWHAPQKVTVSPAAVERCSTVSLKESMCAPKRSLVREMERASPNKRGCEMRRRSVRI